MTIFRNFKNQSAFYNHVNIKQFEYFLEPLVHTKQKLKNTRVVKTEKKRLKIGLAVLDAVRSRFHETNEFIDSTLKEECEKKVPADEVIFLLLNLQKKISLDKHFCFRFGTIVIFLFLFIDMEGFGR